jgi:hypothetical protein
MASATTTPATASGTFTIGGDLSVVRLGYGAMRITGPGIWGEPPGRSQPASSHVAVGRSTRSQLRPARHPHNSRWPGCCGARQ